MDATTTIPERAGREGDQPLPFEGKGDILLRLARETPERFLARRTIGIARYGKPLQAHNGRKAARDLREELLDAMAYAEQLDEEHEDLIAELAQERVLRAAAEARAERAEADLVSHVEAQDRRIDGLKAELAAARANWESERSALEAETAARIQVERQLREERTR